MSSTASSGLAMASEKTLQTSMPKEKKEKTSKEPIRNRINVVRSSASSHMMILHTSYWLWKNNWIRPDTVPCLSLFYLYRAQARHTITSLCQQSNVQAFSPPKYFILSFLSRNYSNTFDTWCIHVFIILRTLQSFWLCGGICHTLLLLLRSLLRY